MAKATTQLYMRTRAQWRAWLTRNHATKTEVWLIYYKKHTTTKCITYDEAVEEALCFGWIDSLVRRMDEDRYTQKYTPRKDRSIWSDLNKKRVAKLKRAGLMTEAGLERIRVAKKNGQWNALQSVENPSQPPRDLTKALSTNKRAAAFWASLAPGQKKQYIWWVVTAKRPETRQKRIKALVVRCAKKIKPGIA